MSVCDPTRGFLNINQGQGGAGGVDWILNQKKSNSFRVVLIRFVSLVFRANDRRLSIVECFGFFFYGGDFRKLFNFDDY